ncbi:unnamed protein product [Thelazia callipaeda]|uniref:GYF domain-containing protein n=1 Tax=Thelazia callipaeda TaxID=103827 RepID=A0A0N5D1G8_THECL|nr:unnamed protein product [Thelazia callipaeda]
MSTTAIAAESNSLNFNPAWMRAVPVSMSTEDGNRCNNRTEPFFVTEKLNVDYPIAEPIFVKNRYGREDLLALLSKNASPPIGLDKCQFFVATAQKPIVLLPFSDTETRLQHNINSSKAMSLLNHVDRATIASGGMIGGAGILAQLRTSQENRSFSPSWMPASGSLVFLKCIFGTSLFSAELEFFSRFYHSFTGVGRGSLQFGRTNAFGSTYRGRGIAQSNSHISDSTIIGRHSFSLFFLTMYANVGVNRNLRSCSTNFGRGSNITQPFSSRAQGLYDPRDPRDRPRQRLRSTSDDVSCQQFGCSIEDSSAGALNSGWTQVGRSAAPWNKRTHANTNTTLQQPSTNSEFPSHSQLPEWMSDDHEREGNSNLGESGSFDDSGQFRTCNIVERMANLTLKSPATTISQINITERFWQGHQKEEKTMMSAVPVSIHSKWSALSENLEQHPNKYPNDAALIGHSLSQTQAASIGLAARSDGVNEWFYVDPKNAVQGPFPTAHMQAWYKLGYFTSSLRVRHEQSPDSSFMTLGELITLNGEDEPFKLKTLPSTVMQLPLQQTQEVSRNIWSRDYNASIIEVAKVKEERQRLEEEQRRVAEQERQLKEMREALMKEEEERIAREQKIIEKELQLQKAELGFTFHSVLFFQKELERLAAEEKERAAAREREIEAEMRRLAEEMEKSRKEEVERALAETRRVCYCSLVVLVVVYQKEEEARWQLKLEMEKLLQEERELKIKERDEEAVKKIVTEQEQKKRQSAIYEKDLSHKSSPETKKEKIFVVAPWVAAKNNGVLDRSEPSLLVIQQEEERQMIEEIKQRQQEHINGGVANEPVCAGVWNSAAQKLQWKSNNQLPFESKSQPLAAWSGAKTGNDNSNAGNNITLSKVVLDLVSGGNEKAKRSVNSLIRSDQESKMTTSAQHEAVKKIFKQAVADNPLTSWMIGRVKELNPQVDADVFAAFIEGVDNPNEVEDYIIGYLGEGRSVKSLIREFLERRSQARQKKEPVDKDDLTHPAQAADGVSIGSASNKPDNSTSQQTFTGGGKRKKKGNKGNKLVVDGAYLGFKGTADPNRTNVGEIDTVGGMTASYSHK